MQGPTLISRSLSLDAPDLDDGFTRPPSLARQLRKRAKRQVPTADDEPRPTAASFFVPNGSLLGMPTNSTLTLFSGLLPSAPANVVTDAHLFFLLVRNRHIADRERLVIWFNGGPGCSSFDGALMEIGPFRLVSGTQQLREIDGAWNEYANVLFGALAAFRTGSPKTG
jgi:carboxypeptidase D